jgi:hypothetical protein
MIARIVWDEGSVATLNGNLQWRTEPHSASVEAIVQHLFDDVLRNSDEPDGKPVVDAIVAVAKKLRASKVEWWP